MKLDKLWIEAFKNLRDFSIDFDETSLVTVIVGWNGAGKSNLIEALVIIFRDLDLGEKASFGYKLEYLIHSAQKVHVVRYSPLSRPINWTNKLQAVHLTFSYHRRQTHCRKAVRNPKGFEWLFYTG